MRLPPPAILLTLFANTVHAGPFEDLFKAAQQYDAVYAGARAQYQADLENREIGRAGLLPAAMLSASQGHANYRRNDNSAPDINKKYQYDNQTLSLRLAQPLFDLEVWSLWRQGDLRASLAEVTWADAQQELVIRYAQAYFEYLLARDSLDLARAQKAALAEQKSQAENLFKAGSATVTDIEETKARLQLAEAGELAAVNAVAARRRDLERLTGGLPANLPSAGAFKAVAPAPADLETWVREARSRNYTVNGQRFGVEIAQQQVERVRAGHYPSAALVMDAQTSKEPNYLTHKDNNASIGVQVSLPLYEGGRVNAQTRQAVAALERARQDLENAARDAEVKAVQSYLDVQNGIAQIDALEAARRSSEITLDGMMSGQKVGLRTNTDVLNAQQQVYDVRRNLQKERYGYLMSRMRLQSTVGSLGGDEVARVDRMLGH